MSIFQGVIRIGADPASRSAATLDSADVSLLVTGFLPDGWTEMGALLGALVVADGARLWRWEEASHADGRRRRAGHVVAIATGPKIETIRAEAVARAQMEGWRFTRLDDDGASVFAKDDKTLAIGTAPLPPRVTIALEDKVARRGAVDFPAIVDAFRLAAAAGAAMLERVDRFAEVDLEDPERFGAPTTTASTRGRHDAAALCRALAAAGYAEDGDAWAKEGDGTITEVRLRDEEVTIKVAPVASF